MNRKKFLSSLLLSGAAIPAGAFTNNRYEDKYLAPILPKYLKPGDTIGITCPAGTITEEEIQPARLQMIEWGFHIKVGETVGKKDFTFEGTDEERAKDFQQMLNDPKIDAIMCARGGYGAVRMIDRLDFSKLVFEPIPVYPIQLMKN